MGSIYTIINNEAKAVNKKHLDPKNGPLDVEGELAKIQSHADSLKEAAMDALKVKYDAKIALLYTTIPVRAAKYRVDRFMSQDAEKYGEENIRMNLNTLITKHLQGATVTNALNEAKADVDEEKKAIDESVKRVSEDVQNFTEHLNAASVLNALSNKLLKKEAPNDFLLRSRTIAQQAETDLEQFENEYKERYDKEKEKTDAKAKEIGEPKGARDVERFNKILDKAAKKIAYIKRQIITRLEIIKNKIIQTVKLKVMALLGL